MSRSNIIWLGTLVLFLILVALIYFNISLTSLPTTFSNMIKDNLESEEAFQQVEHIVVSQGSTVDDDLKVIRPDDDRRFTIENESDIYSLLNSDMRVYNGGRIEQTDKVFNFYIHFEDGSEHHYRIAEGYISATSTDQDKTDYKVLDDQNEVFDYLVSLYDD
ncbi:hypothetical protein [Piscibacillus halophilus]|uniref:Uncharacterized protein n=1 Tax=Piscibacillus halophilus TaxID=571933 RepID=A0A1H9DL77_9BACI|nr:hypothetical protein [Piscibacillus halophilus]SEQ13513.1 hypothetical protein SAMN05216362_10733 [Piscibacillus halophilus]